MYALYVCLICMPYMRLRTVDCIGLPGGRAGYIIYIYTYIHMRIAMRAMPASAVCVCVCVCFKKDASCRQKKNGKMPEGRAGGLP